MLEVSLIELLGKHCRLVVAGDDDQALYALLRDADPDHIRARYGTEGYECFKLPYCQRCTRVIVECIADIVEKAKAAGYLSGRIEKPYLFYPPSKQADSNSYPYVKLVKTSVQMLGKANYFGRYIAEEIKTIPAEQIEESHKGLYPTVLIIGSDPYRSQVVDHLESVGYYVEIAAKDDKMLERNDGLRILQKDPRANLGWRILIETDTLPDAAEFIRQSVAEGAALVDLLPEDFRNGILAELATWVEPTEEETDEAPGPQPEVPTIKATSFESSKGLSAQHVFIVGLHKGEIPRAAKATDFEVCKFLVALTRTRKQCHLIYTGRFAGKLKFPSPFIKWLDASRLHKVKVNKAYWTTPF
jgi:ATP-dependent DNA helicase UvrD/PcrA